MEFNEYQILASKTRTPETEGPKKILYPTLGLTGEAGEVADKVKKVMRDENDVWTEENKLKTAYELGDVLWYVSELARDLGFKLEEIAELNIAKLESRYLRDKIHGSGDER